MWRFELRKILITLVWVVTVFFLFSLRFPQQTRFTTFFVNKTLAETAFTLICLSYLLGPLCKLLPFLGRFIHYRKQFGLAGFSILLAHIGASLLQINDRFKISWYVDHAAGMIAAILATLIFLTIALVSNKSAIQKLGGKKWKMVQRLGYVAIVLTLIHIGVVSWDRWGLWLSGKVAMPNSFLMFVLGVATLLARFLTLFTNKNSTLKNPPPPQSSQTPLNNG